MKKAPPPFERAGGKCLRHFPALRRPCIFSHSIKLLVEQSVPTFRNLSLQANERIWVNRKQLITAWYQISELVQCECHTGKYTVIARINSIKIRIKLLTSGFLEKFGSYPNSQGSGKCPFWPPVDAHGPHYEKGSSTTVGKLIVAKKSRHVWLHIDDIIIVVKKASAPRNFSLVAALILCIRSWWNIVQQKDWPQIGLDFNVYDFQIERNECIDRESRD